MLKILPRLHFLDKGAHLRRQRLHRLALEQGLLGDESLALTLKLGEGTFEFFQSGVSGLDDEFELLDLVFQLLVLLLVDRGAALPRVIRRCLVMLRLFWQMFSPGCLSLGQSLLNGDPLDIFDVEAADIASALVIRLHKFAQLIVEELLDDLVVRDGSPLDSELEPLELAFGAGQRLLESGPRGRYWSIQATLSIGELSLSACQLQI